MITFLLLLFLFLMDVLKQELIFYVKKTIQKKIEERLDELQKEIALKGFRPGKVPPSVIKSQFGKSIYG